MLSLLLCLVGTVEIPVLISSGEVQIGEAVHCTVELSDLKGAELVIAEEVFDPGSSWVVVTPPVIERAAGGRAVLSWSLFALEPEAGTLPVPLFTLSGESVDLVAPAIEVVGALAEGEDAPRPARGFHSPDVGSEASSDGSWSLLVGGLAVLALVLWSLRRRSWKQAEPEQSLSSRLEQLRSEMDGDALRVAALHRELTHLLRAAYGDDNSGWSDEEWVERADLSESQRVDLRGVFSSCADVKYGGARPTRFAVEETLQRAQALISQSEEVAA
jgi:hypothetical protein